MFVQRLRDKQRRDGTLGLALTAVRQAVSPDVLDPLVSAVTCRLGGVVVRHGVAIDISSDALDDTVRARLVSTAHESRERWFVEQYLPRDRPVIELGGGTGFLAAYVDRVLAADTPQIVVEPNPEFRALVTGTRDRNDADFELVAGAYDPAERTFDFQPGETVTGGWVVPASDGDVDGVSLARLAERFDGPFSLVADIEGAEHDLLAEEGDVLARQCDTVVVGFHDTEAGTVQEGVDRLGRLGFKMSGRSGDVVAATNAAADGTNTTMSVDHRRRLLTLAGIWLFAVSVYLHLAPNVAAVPFDTGFHPQQDWLRHHVTQTGSLTPDLPVKTRMSGVMNTRPTNYTSTTLATVTVLIGQRFPDVLGTLTLLPIHGLVVLPLTALVWYRLYARETGGGSDVDALVIVGLALFPFGILLLKFSSGYRTVTYGAALLGLLGYLVAARRSWRAAPLTLLLFVHVANTYHTIVLTLFVFVAGCLGVLVAVVVVPWSDYTLPFGSRGTAAVVCVVGAVGATVAVVTGAGSELVDNLELILSRVSVTSGGVTVETPTFVASQQSFYRNLETLGLGEAAKLVGRLAGVGLVAWYTVRRLPRLRSERRLPAFGPDALVVLTLPVFVVYAGGMYAYGGFGQMVSRTMFVGVLAMFPMLAGLLTRADSRSLVRVLVCVIVVTAAVVAVTSPKWDDTEISSQEAGAVAFTGTHVPDETFVVSDTRLGPSLYYAEHPRLVWLTPERLTTPAARLYGCHTRTERRTAVDTLVERETFDAVGRFDAAVLVTERMRRLGASVWFLRQDVCGSFPRGYDRISQGRVYDSGHGAVFEYTGGES